MIGFDPVSGYAYSTAPDNALLLLGNSDFLIDWEIVIYAATHEYVSRNADDPSEQQFKGTLEKAFRIDRSIVDADRIGERITVGLGEIHLTNSEADYDTLATGVSPVGQLVLIRMGDRTRPYSEWRTILRGFLTDMQMDRESVVFRMRDTGYKLDVPASPNVYGGTGGTDGTTDLQNKTKPRWFGPNLEVSPPLVIPSSLSFQLNDGQIEAVNAVRVRGIEQVFGGDFASVALMEAAGTGSPDIIGTYYTCLAEGWMRLAVATDTELGEVTCDFQGDKAGGIFVQTAADIVRRLLVTSGTNLSDPNDLATETFDDLNDRQGSALGYGIPVGSLETVAASISRIMSSIGGWCGATRLGKFEVDRFEEPSGVPAGLYDRKNIIDVQLLPMPSDYSPPPWRVRVGYNRAWTSPQSNLAGAVDDDHRAFVAQELRYAADENAEVRVDFPPGTELVKDANFDDPADALDEATRLLDLFGTPRALYVFKLCQPLYIHELGQNILLDFPRFDLDGGKLLRIVKIVEDDSEGVEITAFG